MVILVFSLVCVFSSDFRIARAQDFSKEELLTRIEQMELEITRLRGQLDSYATIKQEQTKLPESLLAGFTQEKTQRRKSAFVIPVQKRGPKNERRALSELGQNTQASDIPQTEQKKPDFQNENDKFLNLGVEENYSRYERLRLKDQILTFIPPIYQPAFLGHAYVLPPRVWRVATSVSFLEIDGDDFFKKGKRDFVHESHRVRNRTVNLDIFYGLDHNMTLRLNIPWVFTKSEGSVHPNGVKFLNAFVEGDNDGLGDISLFLKKKWLDQGNYPVNFATVVGVQFPTGSSDKKFDFPVAVQNRLLGAGLGFVGGGSGIFARFSDSGRMPASLQPGTGGFGFHVGAFVTRQFSRFPSAFHAGALATFLENGDGVNPGHRVKFFATYVKPVYKDYLSLELGVNGMWKEDDEYSGRFLPPRSAFPVKRAPFQGGTVVFVSPSIIFNPTPQIRFHFSASIRANKPHLGPWPGVVYQLGTTVTF